VSAPQGVVALIELMEDPFKRHHQLGPSSHHVLGKLFWGYHKLNRAELIAELQELYRKEGGHVLVL